MKRFIISILCVSVFFIGLGALVDNVGAKFKSDEKALALIAQARSAIGGDQALAAVRSMTVTGRATKTFDMEGTARSEQGDIELNMQLPDKFSRMMKIGKNDGEGPGVFEKKVDVIMTTRDGESAKVVVVADGKDAPAKQLIRVRKADGDTTVEGPDGAKGNVVFVRKTDGDGAAWKSENGEMRTVIINKDGEGHGKGMGMGHGEGAAHHQNEMLRTTIALLLTPPEGIDVGYTYAGEEGVDGASCDVIIVEAGGSAFRMYLDKSSHLPRMISYQDVKPIVFTFTANDKPGTGAGANGELHTFTRKVGSPEMAEYQVRFSDYRSVNGVQFPFHWAQSIGGRDDEIVDVTGYEINPANIAEKFQEPKVFLRTKKPE